MMYILSLIGMWLVIGMFAALLMDKLVGSLEDEPFIAGVIVIAWPVALLTLLILLIGKFAIYIMEKIKRKKNEE